MSELAIFIFFQLRITKAKEIDYNIKFRGSIWDLKNLVGL